MKTDLLREDDPEAIASEGLNIQGFHFKWRAAQRLASKDVILDGDHPLPYWERVRLLFLELGGEFLDQDERREHRTAAR